MSNNLDDLREDFEFDDEPEEEFDPEEVEEEDYEDEESGGGGSGFLRILLLLLIILALCICGGLFLLPQFGVGIPGLPDFGGGVPAIPAPADETPTPVEPPEDGETPAAGEVEPGDGATPGEVDSLQPGDGDGTAPSAGEPAPGEGTVEPGAGEAVPGEGTVEPVDGEPAPGEGIVEPGAGEAVPGEGIVEPGAGEAVPSEGTVEPVDGEPAPGESDGPSEYGEDVVTEPQNCDANSDPVADAGGPYMAMQGKGQAVVNFDGSGSSDDGSIVSYEWDFGDGGTDSGETVTYGYRDTDTFEVTLTVTDNCGAFASDTSSVTIVGPTPPADGAPANGDGSNGDASSSDETGGDKGSRDETVASEPAPEPVAPVVYGTAGWCYQVQYGDTLTGIAHRYGVSVPDLARVNVVGPHHRLWAGEKLFVPTGPVDNPPNVYVAQSGDTMYSIANLCGIPVGALGRINDISPDTALTPGQTIIIPPWHW